MAVPTSRAPASRALGGLGTWGGCGGRPQGERGGGWGCKGDDVWVWLHHRSPTPVCSSPIYKSCHVGARLFAGEVLGGRGSPGCLLRPPADRDGAGMVGPD